MTHVEPRVAAPVRFPDPAEGPAPAETRIAAFAVCAAFAVALALIPLSAGLLERRAGWPAVRSRSEPAG
jgi:hypothetical protein